MDIQWLQDFLTVAETGNFTRAANDRNASQPAFSRRIQSLEAWLGVALIDRSVFPTRLTIEGERFRDQAAQILRQLLDARTELSGEPTGRRDQVRLALPHALATGRLPDWWTDWSEGRALSCQLIPGNVHDTVTSLVSGDVDLLVCFHHAQQPIHLDPDVYERVELGTEKLKPYVAKHMVGQCALPGDSSRPLPLLAYSYGTYLGRMVDLIIESAPTPLVATPIFKSDMADVLRELVLAGHGLAWLPDCTARADEDRLVSLDEDKWTITLSVVAYRDRNNGSRALTRLWSALNSG
ncbi:putative LysR family transcriptional regulator (plasmid) [Sinorhizobium fredii HH103]|uniref:LysR family transcriptional regulator n=1 Tax=Sinorhizobium fredii (strain HH103) TaxID=1117943 RepID=G9AIS8_SINF1|nr:LysR family transcriptional regulator [Sinorhizobium fredii]CCF00960.1 putative LysR family transcriptional regulator [Sinorhizobium fredii HH103]